MKNKIYLIALFGFILSIGLASAGIWDNKLGAYYNFTNFNDTLGNYNFTKAGNPTIQTNGCLLSTCLNISGNITAANNYLNLTDARTPDVFNFRAGNKTLNLWFKPSVIPATDTGIMGYNSAGTSSFFFELAGTTGSLILGRLCDVSSSRVFSNITYVTGAWNMTTMVINDTSALFYADSKLVTGCEINTSQSLYNFTLGTDRQYGLQDALIDEMGIWNRTLSQTEITQLYNFGAGLAYNSTTVVSAITVTIGPPVTGQQIVSVGTNFTGNYTMTNINLTNATYYLWNSNDSTLFNATTYTVTGNSTNSTDKFIDSFVFGNNYIWNVYACGINNSGSFLCSFAPSNFTYQSVPFTASDVRYSNTTLETAYERYNLTIQFNSALSATAYLHYNGTRFRSTTICGSTSCTFTNLLDVPLADIDGQNSSFFWNISAFSGTSVTQYTSSTYSQTVKKIALNYCTAGNIALNFTSYDEQNRTRQVPYDFDGSFNYYIGNGGSYRSLNISNLASNETDVCITPVANYSIDSIIAYSAPSANVTYTTRNYFYQKYGINATMQNVPLFLLRTSASTSFILQVQDRQLLAVPNVLVEAQRCYPGSAINQTVFKARTDASGLTTGNLEAETGLYQFYITSNSSVLLAVTPCAKVVPQTAPYTLLFQIGNSYTSPFLNINNATNINSTLVFNYTTNILTLTYIDTSTDFVGAQLVVKSLNFSGNTQPTICTTSSNLSSGILTCNMTGNSGSFTASAYIYRSSQILIDQITFVISTVASTLGYYGPFLGFFIILICAFAFKFNEIAGIVLVNVAIIFCNFVGLIAFGPVFITASLCLSILIIAVLER